jgi:hypothetical protein
MDLRQRAHASRPQDCVSFVRRCEASIPALGIRVVVERRLHQAQRTGLLGTAGSGAVEHDDGAGNDPVSGLPLDLNRLLVWREDPVARPGHEGKLGRQPALPGHPPTAWAGRRTARGASDRRHLLGSDVPAS